MGIVMVVLIGSGSMEIACRVVDFDIAKTTLEQALAVPELVRCYEIYRQR